MPVIYVAPVHLARYLNINPSLSPVSQYNCWEVDSMSEILRRLNGKIEIMQNRNYVIAGGIVLGIGALSAIRSTFNDFKEKHYFASLIERKRIERKTQLSALKKRFSEKPEKYEEIISLTLDELIHLLQTRKLTATEVLEVFTTKAIESNDEFNCITEFVPNAFEIAKELDELVDVKGILHGIPFCVKDDTNVQGVDSTVGCSRNLFKPAKESAVIVQILQDLGGIPFCITNCPQTCISFSSENPIYGKTLNPLNKNLSPGGSSSGTGALVASGGAPFGLGSDTGGSARLPAHFCGITTLKPSKNRVSRKGCLQCIQHCIGLTTVPCLLAPRAKDIAMLFKATTLKNEYNFYDGKAVPIPWNAEVFESRKTLRIGYFTSIPDFPTMGDTTETIMKAKVKLETLGHTVSPFDIKNGSQIRKVIFRLSRADLGKHLLKTLKNDQKSPEMEVLCKLNDLSVTRRKLYSILPGWITGHDPNFHKSALALKNSTDLWDCMAERKDIIESLLEEMKRKEIDVIICPVNPFAAIGVDDVWKTKISLYTFMWNLFDFPAGVVKVGVESGKNIEAFDDLGNARRKHIKECVRKSVGMPIGVQVVGKPFHEELVLRTMIELESSLKS